jgi:hypothetical protein
MSYEGKMLEDLKMPARKKVEEALLISLFKHNGVIKEFGAEEEIVNEIANDFNLSDEQRNAYLETIYRKENRVKRSSLWNRLLFRSADSLAKEKLISRPTQTIKLTNKREWMLSESGFDKALRLLKIPITQKEILPTKSYEVQKIVKKLNETPRPENYNPFDKEKKLVKITKETSLRTRGFRQAVIEAYDFRCAVCRMKLNSPDSELWEVEAAHIVPHSSMGKDDIWNGLSLCRLHHWAFDVGWFTLTDDYSIKVSSKLNSLPSDFGLMGDFDFAKQLANKNSKIFLPSIKDLFPHHTSIHWHRQNIFFQ